MAMGPKPVPPSEHQPIPTKIGSKMGEFTLKNPTWDPKTVLTTTATSNLEIEWTHKAQATPTRKRARDVLALAAGEGSHHLRLLSRSIGFQVGTGATRWFFAEGACRPSLRIHFGICRYTMHETLSVALLAFQGFPSTKQKLSKPEPHKNK